MKILTQRKRGMKINQQSLYSYHYDMKCLRGFLYGNNKLVYFQLDICIKLLASRNNFMIYLGRYIIISLLKLYYIFKDLQAWKSEWMSTMLGNR